MPAMQRPADICSWGAIRFDTGVPGFWLSVFGKQLLFYEIFFRIFMGSVEFLARFVYNG